MCYYCFGRTVIACHMVWCRWRPSAPSSILSRNVADVENYVYVDSLTVNICTENIQNNFGITWNGPSIFYDFFELLSIVTNLIEFIIQQLFGHFFRARAHTYIETLVACLSVPYVKCQEQHDFVYDCIVLIHIAECRKSECDKWCESKQLKWLTSVLIEYYVHIFNSN